MIPQPPTWTILRSLAYKHRAQAILHANEALQAELGSIEYLVAHAKFVYDKRLSEIWMEMWPERKVRDETAAAAQARWLAEELNSSSQKRETATLQGFLSGSAT